MEQETSAEILMGKNLFGAIQLIPNRDGNTATSEQMQEDLHTLLTKASV